jgi:hypothetical protein
MDDKTALAIIYEDYDESEYQVVEDQVDDGHYKHDSTNYYSIVQRLSDKTFWKIMFTSSYNWGVDEYSIYSYEVEKKEVVTHSWVTVGEAL